MEIQTSRHKKGNPDDDFIRRNFEEFSKEEEMKLFTFIKAIWVFMSGKKTNTGSIMLLLAASLVYFNIDVDPEQLRQYVELLVASGAITYITGLIHQFIKKYLKDKE